MSMRISHGPGSLFRGIGPLTLALALLISLQGFGCGDTINEVNETPATVGALALSVSPASAAVTVTGPDSYSESFTGSEALVDLAPGEYAATAQATGYEAQTDSVTITAGNAASMSLWLRPIGEAGSATGSLSISVAPSLAAVTLTGPDSFSETFTGNESFMGLEPGVYTATAELAGFVTEADTTTVFAGEQSMLTLILQSAGGAMDPTTGSLNVAVTPPSARIGVTGPSEFDVAFVGSETLSGLEPGDYVVSATADGYAAAGDMINVEVGVTSLISLNLSRIVPDAPPRYVYRDGAGGLVPLTRDDVTGGGFVFYAWLQDMPGGINPAVRTDLGAPLPAEQAEHAASLTQNLAAAWVGYRDSAGVVRPVIGAEVRWEIDQEFAGRVGSTQYGITDGEAIQDDQADTVTNNGALDNYLYPLGADYPLYNLTGIGAPSVDGFTWVTLFSPDARASSRIVAVATVFGLEIGKEILYKNFAPAPIIEITKDVDADIINIEDDDTVRFTVTVSNVGDGDAQNVDLADYLGSGVGANYSLGPLPAGATANGDGFDISFPLAAGEEIVFTFDATVTAPGIYCNVGQVEEYTGEFDTRTPTDLQDEACFTATEPELTIFKDFVSVAGGVVTSLGSSLTIAAGATAKLRVRVVNFGTGAASVVSVVDALTSVNGSAVTGNDPSYSITLPTGGTANANDGYNSTLGTVSPGDSVTMMFTVTAATDGVYCDTATVFIDAVDAGNSRACLTVATPHLTITKVNAPLVVFPGNSYRSTIVVTNDGSATAHGVVISDLLGINTDATPDVEVIYVSSSLRGLSGMLTGSEVATGLINIAVDQSVTFTVFSLMPFGAPSGDYCDVASFTSVDAGSGEVEACVEVPAFSALQTQLVDLDDPVHAGSTVTYQGVLYIESRSNEGVDHNEVIYSFGRDRPTNLGTPGSFRRLTTRVYLDTSPVQDATTGLIISDPSNATAVLMTQGDRYTLDNSVPGLEIITFDADFMLVPDVALYIVHVVRVPIGTAIGQYTTSYIWSSTGSALDNEASDSESTTVLE